MKVSILDELSFRCEKDRRVGGLVLSKGGWAGRPGHRADTQREKRPRPSPLSVLRPLPSLSCEGIYQVQLAALTLSLICCPLQCDSPLLTECNRIPPTSILGDHF